MSPWIMRRCKKCGEYTLKVDRCPRCGGEVSIPHPAKFSIDDRYARYRRALRSETLSHSTSHNSEKSETTG
ncbi:MAG: RNA-protein complex protein Nop10 [Candidatus Bathyarchaeia archaeon]